MVDAIDRALLTQLQHDTTQPYAALGKAVGLSVGSTHRRLTWRSPDPAVNRRLPGRQRSRSRSTSAASGRPRAPAA
ncbi:AsnC family transcriptional regulator [Plantactinospora mayteni]|uniref:AsnC family transcriptional regulator n=1 Tax=Plantactinospora mayteni TaxID=566021 RepID=UPI0019428EC8